MKKYLMTGVAALAMCAGFTACSSDDFEPMSIDDQAALKVLQLQDQYKFNFENYIGGKVAADQEWGFGATTRSLTRSASSASVAHISSVPNAAYAQELKGKSTELTADNKDADWAGGAYISEGQPVFNAPANYVVHYMISGNWTGDIPKFGAMGMKWTGEFTNVTEWGADPVFENDPRTVYVSGTWTIPSGTTQIANEGAVILVDNGGKIVVEGNLNIQNQAHLVVMPGGSITGNGIVTITNGTAAGKEGYNGGTIDVGTFNNNGGDFYNYGTLKANSLAGGAGGSSFYNHSLVYVDHIGAGSEAPNAKIYNACQWYVEHDMRCLEIENTSYVHVGGQLMVSSSNDGLGSGAYVAMGNGSLLEAGSLYNNGANWIGTGTAVADFGQVTFLNYEDDFSQGRFENLYVNISNQSNAVSGKAGNQVCSDIFWTTVAQNATAVKKGNDVELLPADDNFVAGVSGCTPGFKIEEEEVITADLRIMAEDLTASQASDFDFNDIVLDIVYGDNATLILRAAGGTLPLRIDGKDEWEVHKLFKVFVGYEVNTDAPSVGENGNSGRSMKAVKWQLGRSIKSPADAKGIKLEVQKTVTVTGEDGQSQSVDQWVELTAVKGEPACKIAVDPMTCDWLNERVSIKEHYPTFVEWATAKPFMSKWW